MPESVVTRERKGLSFLGTLALILLIVGGLNWALVGLFNFDLVAALFGEMTTASRAVYVLVGIAALIGLSLFRRVAHDPDRHPA
jgi:uncharacterized protein